jgi:hypothetical protein
MRAKEILSRLTGLNLGPLGAQWNPPEPEVFKARRILTQLEDRRVLYNPSSLEIPQHCVESVIEIRRLITSELGGLNDRSPLSNSLRAMRAACRKFLDHIQTSDRNLVPHGWDHGHWASWDFNAALGELRGVFGVHVAQIAALYRLDIEQGLASILPGLDEAPISKPRQRKSKHNT